MEVNGYQLRDALTRANLERHVAEQQFANCLTAFEGDEKPSPDEVVKNYEKAYEKVCSLQALQEWYNQQVPVTIMGKQMTLALAIKLKDGASRVENMWRQATNDTPDPFGYSRRETARSKEQEYARRTITIKEALQRAVSSSGYTTAIKNAIAQANLKTVQVGSKTGFPVDPELLA